MANPAKLFRDLLGNNPLLVVEIISVGLDGTSIVELPSTDQFIVRGDSVGVGLKAFVLDGVITGEAPNLPLFSLSV